VKLINKCQEAFERRHFLFGALFTWLCPFKSIQTRKSAVYLMTFLRSPDISKKATKMKLISTPLLVVLLALICACSKKDIENAVTNPPDSPGNTSFIANKDVKIELPAGTSFNITSAKLVSMAGETAVAADGGGKIYHDPGSIIIAYVFDKNKNPVLAGFVNDTLTRIDVASTAKVLLYWAHGILFTNNTKLTQNYIRSADQVPGIREWIKEFTELFKNDPLTFSNKTFLPALKARMNKMKAVPTVNIYGKPSDVVVDGGDRRSGLQVFDDGISNFSINNYYRRRAHAFLYKMKSRDESGHEKPIRREIEKGTLSDKDFPVDPVAAVNSVTGEIGKWIEDKDAQSVVVKTGPTTLELAEQEVEAEYALRIVGPGYDTTFMTTREFDRMMILNLETFTFDVVLPAIAAGLSAKDMMSAPAAMDPGLKQRIMTLIKDQWKAVPDMYDDVKKGDYKTALAKLLENLYKDASKEVLLEIVLTTAQIYTLDKDISASAVTGKLDKVLKILSAIDIALTAGDIGRITLHQGLSNWADEWKVRARSSQVRLEPGNITIYYTDLTPIAAVIKNLQLRKDVHAFYEWSCSGKFGVIKDNRGHTGTKFESADSIVRYDPNTKLDALSEGENLEYIYVVARVADKIIGRDTAVVDVRKFNDLFTLKPSGVTVSGKEGQNASVQLYLEPLDLNPKHGIPNFLYDYMVVWSTAGKHGKLVNYGMNENTFTTFDKNNMTYQCLDKDTKEGKEVITARIYKRIQTSHPKAEDFKLHSEVKVTINISNDPKKRILQIPFTRLHADSKSGPYTSYPSGSTYYEYKHWVGNVIEIPQDTAAVSYSVKYIWTDIKVIPTPTGASWTADKFPSNSPPAWVRPALSNGVYTVVYSWGSSAGPREPAEGHYVDAGGPSRGMAEVTITLK
jgi:hypothetical protein